MTVLLVGCGRMGGAMARAWAGGERVLAHDPNRAPPEGVERVASLDAADVGGDAVVVLAVKPQGFGAVAPSLPPFAARGALFVSIMAGVTLARLGEALGGGRVVRCMPNTPAAIGRGITAAVAGEGVSPADRDRVDALLRATGDVLWLDREALLDAVTAVSGSGPAYFFRFTEALARAGVAAGLDADDAMRLARATFTGSAALAASRPEPVAMLRGEVTSPGGTTAAGLAVLDAGDALDRLACDVVAAAAARSRELG